MKRRTTARRAGFTILEMVISTALLMVIVSMMASAVVEDARLSTWDVASFDASSAARRILSQVTRELSDAGGHAGGTDFCTPGRAAGGSFGGPRASGPALALPATCLTFRQRRQLTGVEATDWPDAPISYELRAAVGETPGDGDDDDADGVPDEMQLVRIQNGLAAPLDDRVTLFRIDRAAGSDVITISLEVGRGLRQAFEGQASWARCRLVTNILVRNRSQVGP